MSLFALVVGACSPGPNNYDLQQMRKHEANADRASLAGDYATAEQEMRKALRIATETNFDDGIISSKLRLGEIYLVTNRSDLAEREYLDAIAVCRGNTRCTWMDNAYGHLLFLYAYELRNPEKTVSSAKELKGLVGWPNNDAKTVNEQLRACVSLLRSAGLPNAANEVDGLIEPTSK